MQLLKLKYESPRFVFVWKTYFSNEVVKNFDLCCRVGQTNFQYIVFSLLIANNVVFFLPVWTIVNHLFLIDVGWWKQFQSSNCGEMSSSKLIFLIHWWPPLSKTTGGSSLPREPPQTCYWCQVVHSSSVMEGKAEKPYVSRTAVNQPGKFTRFKGTTTEARWILFIRCEFKFQSQK